MVAMSGSTPDRGMTPYAPLLARTRTIHRPVGPIAYDCVKVIVVRDGSAILFSEFGQKPVKPGDVIVLGANTLCGSEPEGHITVTTVYLDTDFVLDQVRWQYAGFVADRLDAQGFADTMYSEPAQILRLGEDRAGMLMPWLDELVALSIDGEFVRHYLRMQALWFQIAYVIAPFIKVSRYVSHRHSVRISDPHFLETAGSRPCGSKCGVRLTCSERIRHDGGRWTILPPRYIFRRPG